METQTSKTALFLINDNDPVLQRVIRNKFKKEAGWDSVIAKNYDEAVALFEEKNPDMILTEIILNDTRGRTGFDFIVSINAKKRKEVVVIVLTELSQEEDKQKAAELGVGHYYVKSEISISDLIENIKAL